MKRISLSLSLCLLSLLSFGWGQTGHRTIAHIAQNHLNKKAQKAIHKLMGHESLVQASTWMDEIRSDDAYDHTHPWHYVTIPEGETYASCEKNEKGDAYEAIARMIKILKDESADKVKQQEAMRMLVHLVGDIHQPLHVGNGEDRGGNDVKIKWFYDKSNLHRIWDSEMIDSKQYSYSELALQTDHPHEEKPSVYHTTDKDVWVEEAMNLRPQVYAIGEKDYLSYEYMYKNWHTVKDRLHRAGLRLAAILNDIYG
ncbi:MAG: S1/P1 nuclease [Vicingaceae bacterium]